MRAIRVASLMIIASFASASIAGTVFRSVDEQGQAVFSDRPSVNSMSEAIELETKRSNTTELTAKNAEQAEYTVAAALRESQESEDRTDQQRLKAEVVLERAANCAAARARQEKYETNHRLYKPLANGEREYLSSDELDDARVEAVRAVKEWCS